MSQHQHAARVAANQAKEKKYMHRLPPAEMFQNRGGKTTTAEKIAIGVFAAVMVLATIVAVVVLVTI